MKLNILIFLLVVSSITGATFLLDRTSFAPQNPIFGDEKKLPDFSFTALDGRTHSASDFKGKVILLNFWASWCAPCVKEFPALLDIAAAHPDDLVLIALSSDTDETAVKKFLNKIAPEKGHKIPDNVYIALDKSDVTGTIFHISRLPESLIADKALMIRHELIGAEWDVGDIKKLINSLAE